MSSARKPSDTTGVVPGGTRESAAVAALLLAAGAACLWTTDPQKYAQSAYVLLGFSALLLVVTAIRVLMRRNRRDGRREAGEAGTAGPAEDEPRTLWKLRACVQDTPGRLAELAAQLAAVGGNIRTVHVHPTADGAVDEVLVHAPSRVTATQLVRACTAAGGTGVIASRADVRQLDDLPTRALTLATALVTGRRELIHALRAMLGPVEIKWQEHAAEDVESGERWLCLEAPGGGFLMLTRQGATFTPAEFARARALADLAANCQLDGRDAERISIAGTELLLRQASRQDLGLVAGFHDRCSNSARYQRYFSPAPTTAGLLKLLTPTLGRTLVVLDPAGEVIAMANLMYKGDTGELALLVRDDWQRHGIGSMLAKRLVAEAEDLGLRRLDAHTQVENAVIARLLREAGLTLSGVPEPGEWSWSRPVHATGGSR